MSHLRGSGQGWEGATEGRWHFLLGAGQRVEGSLNQQPLIGSCCLVASPDWVICSGRCLGGAVGRGEPPGVCGLAKELGAEGPRWCSDTRAADL